MLKCLVFLELHQRRPQIFCGCPQVGSNNINDLGAGGRISGVQEEGNFWNSPGQMLGCSGGQEVGSGEAREGEGNLWNSPAHLRAHRATGRCLVEKIHTKVVQFGLAAWQFGKSRTPCLPPALACRLRKTDDLAGTVGKTDDSGLLAAQTALLAPKTASQRASWRLRRAS